MNYIALSPGMNEADSADGPHTDSPSEEDTLTHDDLIADVGAQLDAVDCAGSFSVYVPSKIQVNPGLEVEGLGRFGTPLYDRDIQLLKQKTRQAPFGKGEETIVDTAVRNTWEIDASQLRLTHPDWKRQEQSILETICTNLGVNGGSGNVHAELYKLLIYEEGAHFKPHRDSEKAKGMYKDCVLLLVPKVKWVDLRLNTNYSLEGKKQVIRAHFDSMHSGSVGEEKLKIAEHLLKRFLRGDPTGPSSSWGPAPQHEAFFFELLEKCVQLGLVAQLAKALLSADQKMAAVIINNAHVLLPQVGFDTIAPCLEAAVQQSMDIQTRTELIWRIEGAVGEQSNDAFTQWRDRQSAKSLVMPLGQIGRAVPILTEMAVRNQASNWTEDKCVLILLPALKGRMSDAKILFHFASDLLSRAHLVQFPVPRAVETYRTLMPTITQGILLPAEAPRQNYWRGPINENAGPFESGDLARLLGDLLRMHRMQLLPDAMQHISRLHQRIADLATSTIIPNIHSILIPYMKVNAQLMSSHGVPPSEQAFQQLFTSLIHQVVYRYVCHEPQPGSLTRAARGCGRCAECNQLDNILQSSKERGGSVFVRFKKDIAHLTSQFTKKHNRYSYSSRPDNITTIPQMQRVPFSFEITKVEGDFKRWEGRFNETQGLLSTIASEAMLRQLLGQRYDELIHLHGTILVQYGAASSCMAEAVPSMGTTQKRKGSSEDQENREPPAKRVAAGEVVDLSESP
ncbi:hypothetical protein M409DRAFT_48622 [Zasmidium cellare ATCC 36951]|uniref:Prolyl 4-hydroxylase alpha subunit Fe(2+) 2OG dioxygenase domain-containing protein n=1 Tax=Zasmidium cellare ATCC 36951 TaxID=1080233 RepID=A0A6A6D636_ZASCE|nr:uncharacterized protein M409DRAFT_48622 [Zasmidium cellare ATCC 36951]KAF2173682.1 hypothetical protein M409DRAFT_48622 [Zasmidium cellare ATCC 36951]